MSLSVALSSAASSLQSLQTQLSVASANIANADTEGYTAKKASKANTVTGGIGTGSTITGIDSKVDANLLRSIVSATSEDGESAITADFLDRLGDALGALSSEGSGDTLAAAVSAVAAAFEELAATPESETLKTQAVLAVDAAATALRDTSSQVQLLRQQADADIETAVQTVNQALVTIDELNQAITQAKAAGNPTGDLEDQRMNAVRTVAAEMDVSYFTDNTGAMKVYTGSGDPLVTSTVHLLSHDSASTVTSATTVSGGFDGIWLNGKDITGSLKSGAMAGLVTLRDETLPAVQDSLDSVAVSLSNTLNTVHNQGSAAPPPQSLTGTTTGISGADALAATGTLRVAVTDGEGNVVTTQDIDLSSVATVDDLLTSINAIGGVSASLDADGRLQLSATATGNGVAISGGDIGGADVSSYFGLNDLLTGEGAESIAIRSDLLNSPSLLATGTLSEASSLTAGDTAVTVGSGRRAQSIADAMTTAGVENAAAAVVSDVGTLSSQAESRATSAETTLTSLTDSFSSSYGVNIDEESARITELENAYSASAQVISAIQSMFDDLLQAVR